MIFVIYLNNESSFLESAQTKNLKSAHMQISMFVISSFAF